MELGVDAIAQAHNTRDLDGESESRVESDESSLFSKLNIHL